MPASILIILLFAIVIWRFYPKIVVWFHNDTTKAEKIIEKGTKKRGRK